MTGLLWFDKSTRSVTDKISDAADRYRAKFGHAPTVCYVNEADAGQVERVGRVEVRSANNVLKWHYFVVEG